MQHTGYSSDNENHPKPFYLSKPKRKKYRKTRASIKSYNMLANIENNVARLTISPMVKKHTQHRRRKQQHCKLLNSNMSFKNTLTQKRKLNNIARISHISTTSSINGYETDHEDD